MTVPFPINVWGSSGFPFSKNGFPLKRGNSIPVETDPILAYFQSTGADGAYYTPWDKSTLFQDVAGTIPVVNDGDPVARLSDISGNGCHATTSVSSKRPNYSGGLIIPDGVDDSMSAISNNTKTGVVVFSVLFSLDNLAGTQIIFETGTNTFNRAGCAILMVGGNILIRSNVEDIRYDYQIISPITGKNYLITIRVDNNSIIYRVDGLEMYIQNINQNSIMPSDLFIFARNNQGSYFKGIFGGLLVINDNPSISEISAFENHIINSAGVTL